MFERKSVLGHRRRRLSRLASLRPPARGGPRGRLRRQFLHRHQAQHRAPARPSALRAHAPRRDVSALRRGRRDLQPRLPGLADPLPARSRADDQDQRARRHQHAGAGQAPAGAASCRPRPARCTAIRRCIRSARTTGATSIPIGPRSCYDEGKRCAETLFFDYYRQHKLEIKVARIFNTYGPRMHPNDGRVVSNFIVQALKGEPITIYGDGSQTRSFCYVDDLIEGLVRLMESPDGFHRPGQPRQSRRVHHARARRAGDRADGLEVEAHAISRCRRTIPSSASPTSRSPTRSSAGSRRCRCARG